MSSKLPSLPLFTDTFTADTVHLTNESVGIYIRLLCFNWTKGSVPFTRENAYRVGQCRSEECKKIVDLVLKEFFTHNRKEDVYTHKRLVADHDYLTRYYQKKSDAGKKGMEPRYRSVSNKTLTPNPIPKPIPNNILLDKFNVFWGLLRVKNGSKKLAQQKYLTHCKDLKPEDIANTFNRLADKTKDKTFVPHVCTWLNQERWLDEETSKPKTVKIPDTFYNGIKLKKQGEFGQYEEFIDDKGNKYQKHKWKNEDIIPLN